MVLGMYLLLQQENARLKILCSVTEFADNSSFLALSWQTLGGHNLAKFATQADIRMLLQLLSCSQASPSVLLCALSTR